MYKQGPAGHEECELNRSGKEDAGKRSTDSQSWEEQLRSPWSRGAAPGGFSVPQVLGGPGSGLRFSSSPFIWIESAWKTNQALADNM